MQTLVIAEHNNQQLNNVTLNTITAALQLTKTCSILVAGYQCDKVITQLQKVQGIEKILVADNKVYEHCLAENTAPLIKEAAKNFTHILAPATTFGKNILPRVAALLNVGQISDVMQIISEKEFIRPIYAGNVLATLESQDPIKIITIRISAFEPATITEKSTAEIQKLDIVIENNLSEFVEQKLSITQRPDLTAAKIIISGGRGLQNAENFKLLEKIADQLGAAIGASRAAVDAGFISNDYQVGQTGKVVAPDLYIAIGISGAIQHLAGMKDSKIIVAINKDPDAPIFQIADYGLVADFLQIYPELEKELNQLHS